MPTLMLNPNLVLSLQHRHCGSLSVDALYHLVFFHIHSYLLFCNIVDFNGMMVVCC